MGIYVEREGEGRREREGERPEERERQTETVTKTREWTEKENRSCKYCGSQVLLIYTLVLSVIEIQNKMYHSDILHCSTYSYHSQSNVSH